MTNDSAAVYQQVNVIGVYNPPGTNDPDIITTETGHVFVAQSPEQFSYDDDGNLLSDGRFNYSWDAENRLISAETLSSLPASVPRVKLEFAYDYMSRRVGKAVYSGLTNGVYSATNATTFLYDGWSPIRELCHSGTLGLWTTNSYVWGLDLSGSLGGAGGIGGLLAVVKGTNAYAVAYDANGNVSEYLADNGTVAAHYEYSPFGETIVASGVIADSFAHRFSTKFTDDETALLYYGYRHYSPFLGRWLSKDPIGVRGGKNLYVIVSNDPIFHYDLRGLFTRSEVDFIAGYMGAGAFFKPNSLRAKEVSRDDDADFKWTKCKYECKVKVTWAPVDTGSTITIPFTPGMYADQAGGDVLDQVYGRIYQHEEGHKSIFDTMINLLNVFFENTEEDVSEYTACLKAYAKDWSEFAAFKAKWDEAYGTAQTMWESTDFDRFADVYMIIINGSYDPD